MNPFLAARSSACVADPVRRVAMAPTAPVVVPAAALVTAPLATPVAAPSGGTAAGSASLAVPPTSDLR